MAFEILEKEGRKILLNKDEISISKSAIIFGDNIDLKRFPYIEVWIDRDTNQIGFKGTNNSSNGYSVKLDKGKNYDRCRITSKHTSLFPVGKYKPRKVRDMYVIDVLELADINNAQIV
jgi:hypothetical protein